jgi:hypothetical protein
LLRAAEFELKDKEDVMAQNVKATKKTKRDRIVLPRSKPDESFLKILLTGLFPR